MTSPTCGSLSHEAAARSHLLITGIELTMFLFLGTRLAQVATPIARTIYLGMIAFHLASTLTHYRRARRDG